MPTTILFQSPQGGTQIPAGQPAILTTLDVSNNKNLRITYKHSNGNGSVTATAKILHEAQGNNSNLVLATLDAVTLNNLQTVTRRHTDFLGRRLRIEASVSVPDFPQNIIVIVLGDS